MTTQISIDLLKLLNAGASGRDALAALMGDDAADHWIGQVYDDLRAKALDAHRAELTCGSCPFRVDYGRGPVCDTSRGRQHGEWTHADSEACRQHPEWTPEEMES